MFVNEFDPFAAAWCRELMAAGCVPHGVVDERSIADVEATDVRGHRRAHFFAGILGWELALQLAGWPPEREVFTGSCPCQDFSSAGKRKGIGAERDLWPQFARLIRECRPEVVFGEQVASSEVVGNGDEAAFVTAVQAGDYARANRYAERIAERVAKLRDAPRLEDLAPVWVDRLRADLEGAGYAVRFKVLGAHSAGADHIRQRLYWVAHTGRDGLRAGGRGAADGAPCGMQGADGERERVRPDVGASGGGIGAGRGMADAGHAGPRSGGARTGRLETQERSQPEQHFAVRGVVARGMGDPGGDELGRLAGSSLGAQAEGAGVGQVDGACGVVPRPASGAVWDHWRNAVGIDCRDGKRRRVPAQPGVQCVADGLPAGVGRGGVPCAHRYPLAGKSHNRAARLRGYGNAICVQTAALFVRAFLESEGDGE